MNIQELLAANRITASVAARDANPNMSRDNWSNGANHWLVTLRHNGHRMSVPFSTGAALNEPTAADVLECLASDANSVEYVTSFEEWADELGFDPDSREAFRAFETTRKQSRRLKQFLGDDLYDELLSAE